MPVVKRGLVAPQNTFLENVIRRCNNSDTSFILANAQIVEYPIVYCNDGFAKMVGYSRAEIMQKPCSLSFMRADYSGPEAVKKIQNALDMCQHEQTEIGLRKKNRSLLWLLMHISPIKNDNNQVVLYLCQFRDITPLKQPLYDENHKGFSRILQIARIAKSRQQFNQIETRDLHKTTSTTSSNFNQVIKVMNLGGDLLPQYRQETPKTSPHIILHYSTFKTIWDWSILALTFYTAFIVPYNIAFKTREHPPRGTIDMVALMDSIVDVIFFADILLNFHTTFVGPGGEVVIDPNIIRHNYFKSWFLIDLLSCLPYDIFYMFKHNDERIGSLLSALKVVRLLRLGRVARKLDNYLEYGAATLLLLLCAYVLAAHWLACVWFSIGEYEVKIRFLVPTMPEGWLTKLSKELNAPFNYTFKDRLRLVGGPQRSSAYISALYFTMSCLSTVGFGNIASTTDNEKVFGVCMMIVAALLYAAIFGHMTNIIQQMTSATIRYHDMIANIREFIKLQEVPNELAERVLDYVISTWAMTKGIDTSKVLSYCPRDMKADICVHLNRKVFNEHACFRLASDGCLRQFAVNFESNHAAPGDLIYHTGESVDALWFVVSGSLEVIQDDEVVAILGKGDVFGDEFWKQLGTGQSAANVRALTYTDLHSIKKNKLMEVLDFYKAFANSFARNMVLTYNLTRRLKFRKVVDVKREKELDERRKNEKLTIPAEHPVRKLLFRMRERHSIRILPSQVFADLEQQARKRSSIIRTTATSVDDVNEVRWSTDVQRNTDNIRLNALPPELKKCFERIEEKLHTVNYISHKLENLEKLVFELYHSIKGNNEVNISGSKKTEQQQLLTQTTAVNLMNRRSTEPFVSINSPPPIESTTHLSVSIPPLQDLNTDNENDEFQSSTQNFATLLYIEDEIASGTFIDKSLIIFLEENQFLPNNSKRQNKTLSKKNSIKKTTLCNSFIANIFN